MRSLLKELATVACLGFFACQVQAKQSPNVVIIFLDDMGYRDLSVTGSTGYTTPNIDKLCTEGMRFTHFYAAQAVCSASRAGLLTGCYPNRIGFSGALSPNALVGIHENEVTLGEMLQEKGYRSGAFGKWHLGDAPQFNPVRNGFHEYFGLLYSNDMWLHHPQNRWHGFKELPLYEGDKVVNPNVTASDQAQLTTWYTEKSVDFIRRNKDKPFFLYLAHSMPHVPLFVSDKFKGKSEQGLYGDVMMEIDWSVGEVMKALAENGVADNTLVVFTSDNGPWITYGNHAGSTGGLREGKGSSFEGGQRVPCIMKWTPVIPQGTICNQLSSTIDLLPTIAVITGARLPEHKIDGVNILPLLEGKEGVTPRKHLLYYFNKNNLEAVRNERFKLVLPHPGLTNEGFLPGKDGLPGATTSGRHFPKALYDLRRDPGERYDVQDANPEAVEELMKVVEAAREDLGDDLTSRPGTGRREIGRVKKD
ncbi:MAG: sulfatase [Puniceicoccales bacterium]|jgi:arylsulfatase|nr:sulfatase [Puniceicoccales bacterium]